MNSSKNKTKVAIFEIGGSHDECILTQLIALKNAGCYVAFCSTKELYERNLKFKELFDEFKEVVLPRTMLGDFRAMRDLNNWLEKEGFTKLIANTGQGGHVRNLSLTAPKTIEFFGIIHTIKMLQGSFTQNLISKKIKQYFVLNDTLLEKENYKKAKVSVFYPIDFPRFDTTIDKPSQEFWIGIIGGLEFRRKDLSGFVAFAKNVPEHVRFIFLGKSDVKHPDVIAFMQMVEEAGITNKIKWFEHFVEQEEFDAYCKSFDAILPLIHPHTPSADEYFTRQIPGSINVAFGYGIPMMIHERYKDWSDFDKGCVFYNLENMNAQLLDLIKNVNTLQQDLQSVEKFKSEYQQKKFASIILGN